MARNSPREAVQALLRSLRQSLACVTLEHHVAIDGTGEGLHDLSLPGMRSVSLVGSERLRLFVGQRVAVIPMDARRREWRVTTRQYTYRIAHETGAEVLTFHWHPGAGPISQPHLHVDGPAPIARRMHVPTRRVALEDVLLFVIRDLNVPPVRNDWQLVLTRNAAEFRRRQTWW